MQDIVIYGAGSFGREVKMLIEQINDAQKTWNMLGFIDDINPVGKEVGGLEILGGMDFLNNYPKKIAVCIAVGSPQGLQSIVSKITNSFVFFPNLIHPQIYMSQTNGLGNGNILTMGVKFTINIIVGNFNVFNLGATIAHDANIGNFNIFGPNTQLSGNIHVGDKNLFGVGSVVLEQIKIGNNSTIGASSLVVKNTEDDLSYFGVPAFVMRKKS